MPTGAQVAQPQTKPTGETILLSHLLGLVDAKAVTAAGVVDLRVLFASYLGVGAAYSGTVASEPAGGPHDWGSSSASPAIPGWAFGNTPPAAGLLLGTRGRLP